MLMDDPVEAAARRVRSGDRGAYRVVVEAHQAGVRAAIASYGIPAADVDDLAQDTFVFAFQHFAEYTPGTSLGAWLKTIGRYKALAYLDAARRESKNRANALRHFLDEQIRERAAGIDAGPWADRLRGCVAKLSPRQAGILRRRYEGVPLVEISRDLSVSVDAVKMLLLRIRRGLRKCMESSP
jgi:RNA polymerase sigma factor (sigma-70 family)